jgi:hypothetical protein
MGRLTHYPKRQAHSGHSLRSLPPWTCIYDVGASAALLVKNYFLLLNKRDLSYTKVQITKKSISDEGQSKVNYRYPKAVAACGSVL